MNNCKRMNEIKSPYLPFQGYRLDDKRVALVKEAVVYFHSSKTTITKVLRSRCVEGKDYIIAYTADIRKFKSQNIEPPELRTHHCYFIYLSGLRKLEGYFREKKGFDKEPLPEDALAPCIPEDEVKIPSEEEERAVEAPEELTFLKYSPMNDWMTQRVVVSFNALGAVLRIREGRVKESQLLAKRLDPHILKLAVNLLIDLRTLAEVG